LIDALCDFLLRQRPNNHQVAQSLNPYARVAFQQQPTQADRQRSKFAKWRQLESAVKRALQGQAVSIIFRGDQLVLKDQGGNVNNVWSALQNLRKKYAFTVALHGKSAPSGNTNTPLLLWIKTTQSGPKTLRTWTLRESVT
jgi:D-alanyl-D-alanine carboxypeptidase/D-alanyl-D-alanine-endopeptidase (penicillin-binding protein 4)